MAGPFDHDLHIVLPGNVGQFAERFKFGKLCLVVSVIARAGTQPVAERERYIVGLHDFADLFEMRVKERFLVMRKTPLRHDRTAARNDTGHAFGGHRNVGEADTGVYRKVINALLGLLDQRVAEHFPRQFLGLAVDFKSARYRSAPASCARSIRAFHGCSCPSTGPSRCHHPSASTTSSFRLPRRSSSTVPSYQCWH